MVGLPLLLGSIIGLTSRAPPHHMGRVSGCVVGVIQMADEQVTKQRESECRCAESQTQRHASAPVWLHHSTLSGVHMRPWVHQTAHTFTHM